ncbi:MAG: N-formylglutamate amidohydrolase [Alphaproteobacteria bacterium]|nr:N-formylglutamate amidohydrolase [Alphaproteobacteria bacterium]
MTRALLGPNDPPPFETVNPDGPAPILLVCDHASNRFPAELRQLGLDGEALNRHIAHDIGAAEVTRHLSVHLNAPAVLAGYSRLVIDLNRQPGHPSSIVAESDGTPIPGNRAVGEAARAQRVEALFWPYHRALGDLLAKIWRRGRPPILFSVHSFTPRMNGEDRKWHAGVLWNRDPRLPRPLIEGLSRDKALIVGDNLPYSGLDLAYTLDLHAGAAGLAHAAIEIRQDLVETEAGTRAWARRLADVLSPLIGRDELHRVEQFD